MADRSLIDRLLLTLSTTAVSAMPATALAVLLDDPAVADARLWLLDVAGDTLTDCLQPTESIPVDGTAAGIAVREQAPMLSNGTALIPVAERGRVLGLLEVTSTDPDTLVESSHLLAPLMAQAVTDSRRYGDGLDRSLGTQLLSVPATIQHEMLPPSTYEDTVVEVAGRLEPAYEVAGDLYDYAANPEGIHMAVFDAVGHDLNSTILSTLAVGAYRLGRRQGKPLIELAGLIDETVRSRGSDADFVTGVLALLELSTGELQIWNSGHPDPLLVRGNEVTELDVSPRCLPFGLGPFDGRVLSLKVERGDVIVLYTDGITEARDSGRQQWGMRGLQQALTDGDESDPNLSRLAKSVLDRVIAHVGADLSDDAALMLIRPR